MCFSVETSFLPPQRRLWCGFIVATVWALKGRQLPQSICKGKKAQEEVKPQLRFLSVCQLMLSHRKCSSLQDLMAPSGSKLNGIQVKLWLELICNFLTIKVKSCNESVTGVKMIRVPVISLLYAVVLVAAVVMNKKILLDWNQPTFQSIDWMRFSRSLDQECQTHFSFRTTFSPIWSQMGWMSKITA